MIDDIVITGLGLVTPFASTPAQLSAAEPDALESPGDGWFDAERHFGPYGFKNLMLSTRYSTVATEFALRDACLDAGAAPLERMGVAMGTNFGNYRVMADMDEVIRSKGVQGIRPMQAPNFSLNLSASHLSIRHQLRAFNIVLTNPLVAGLQALSVAALKLRDGSAEGAVAGALEDEAPSRAAKALGLAAGRGGAVALVLEPRRAADRRGRTPYCVLARYGSGFISPNASEEAQRCAVAALMSRVLGERQTAGTTFYACPGYPNDFNLRIDRLAREWLAVYGALHVLTPIGTSGAFMSVSPMLLACSLAATQGEGIVLAASPFGEVAVVELTKP